MSLSKLTKLKTLNCGANKIDGKGITEFTRVCTTIQRLNLSGLGYDDSKYGTLTDDDLISIASNIKLTHLNICNSI